jgi:hypothetical protein
MQIVGNSQRANVNSLIGVGFDPGGRYVVRSTKTPQSAVVWDKEGVGGGVEVNGVD